MDFSRRSGGHQSSVGGPGRETPGGARLAGVGRARKRWLRKFEAPGVCASWLVLAFAGCDQSTEQAVRERTPSASAEASRGSSASALPSSPPSSPPAPAFSTSGSAQAPASAAPLARSFGDAVGDALVRPVSGAPLAPAAQPLPPPAAVAVPQGVEPLSELAKTEDERNSIQVFEAVAPATVYVTQTRQVVDYFAGRAVEVPAGTGSGFIWDKQGHVVTNFHVIQGARSLSVTLHNQKTFDAEVVGAEPRKDVAVLRIIDAPADLVPIVVERSTKLKVGQKTLAIGNPFGLDQTLTTGIISALGRSVPGAGGVTIRDMVQTDAAINPGNSGGPLLDSSGRLIGMNTMIYSKSGSSAGIGFAVPVGAIARIVPQIIRTGKAEQVGIGVNIDPEQAMERRFGISGVLVMAIKPDSPAARAGLQGASRTRRGWVFGDVIVGIGDQAVREYDDLYNALDGRRPGEKVKVTVQREQRRLTLEVELELLP